MTDHRAAFDEEGLPWLEGVADQEGPRGVSARKMLAALVIVGLAATLVAATFFVIGRRHAGSTVGPAELIKADPRPYKVKPADPGGLDVAGDSQTAFATSAGADTDAQIDINAVTEAPLARPPKQEPAKPKPVPAADMPELAATRPAEAEKSTPPPEPVPAVSGTVVQLGAFSSGAKAEAAWKALTARFASLGALTKIVVPVTNPSGGSFYRLRAAAGSSADARTLCQSLRVAGESCVVIGG